MRKSFCLFAPQARDGRDAEVFERYRRPPSMLPPIAAKQCRRAWSPAVTYADSAAPPPGEGASQGNRRLIRDGGEFTGVPGLPHGFIDVHKPIVGSPEHALAMFKGGEENSPVLENSRIATPGPA